MNNEFTPRPRVGGEFLNLAELHSCSVQEIQARKDRLMSRIQAIDDPEAILELGEDLIDQPALAMKCFSRAVSLDPMDLGRILHVANWYLLLGNCSGACEMLADAWLLDPEDEDVEHLASLILPDIDPH